MRKRTEEANYIVAVGSVLLIDGDNDPHLPPGFEINDSTLVRIFLRPGASVPKLLDRKLGPLPMKTAVLSQEGGRNAADFVMALHAGLLHASVPMSVPFTLVTADKKLGAIVEELQRIGRPASLWTSHPERGRRASSPAKTPVRRKPVSRRGRSSSTPSRTRAAKPVRSENPSELDKVVRAYAARLKQVKDPPRKLQTLLNDIANRAGGDQKPEDVVSALKKRGVITVDSQGRVKLG